MQVEKLIEAAELLGEIATNFRNMPEEQQKTVSACLQIQIVQMYLLDLSHHLVQGADPYEAMLMAAKGDTPIF